MGIYLGATELSTGGGGGGGFTKINKYSTYRALNDTTNKLPPASISGITYTNTAAGETTFVWYDQTAGPYLRGNGVYNGWTFINNSTTYTVTSTTDNGSNQYTMVFSPALTATINGFVPIVMLSDQFFTVNPATDLGLADGASLGFFMIGGGNSNASTSQGAKGGNILQGTRIITTASTNLILTPGAATAGQGGAASAISGGLTLTTDDGANQGWPSKDNTKANSNAWGGIDGYGIGGGLWNEGGAYGTVGANFHGFGGGSHNTGVAGDGAILLYY